MEQHFIHSFCRYIIAKTQLVLVWIRFIVLSRCRSLRRSRGNTKNTALNVRYHHDAGLRVRHDCNIWEKFEWLRMSRVLLVKMVLVLEFVSRSILVVSVLHHRPRVCTTATGLGVQCPGQKLMPETLIRRKARCRPAGRHFSYLIADDTFALHFPR